MKEALILILAELNVNVSLSAITKAPEITDHNPPISAVPKWNIAVK
jgi:hypothetical protein